MFGPDSGLTHCYRALPGRDSKDNFLYTVRSVRKLLDNYCLELHGSCRTLKSYIMKVLDVFTAPEPASKLRRPRTTRCVQQHALRVPKAIVRPKKRVVLGAQMKGNDAACQVWQKLIAALRPRHLVKSSKASSSR